MAVEVMRSGIHRVNVLSPEGHVLGVVSQTDVIRCLLGRPELAPALVDMHVRNLNVCHSPAIFVRGP
jgi:hypothetical protein